MNFSENIYKKYVEIIMKIVVVILLVSSLVGGCTALNRKFCLSDDNIIEEAVENKVKDIIEIDIYLSPESIES